MPFDEEEDLLEEDSKKVGLKNVSTKKSIFDTMPKKPTQKDLDNQVKDIEEKKSGYKKQAAEYSSAFKKIVADKTLQQNRNVFVNEVEQETLSKLISLAATINQDPNEQEGIGSLMIITLLLKTCLYQRDRINQLEYQMSQFERKTDIINLKNLISKEISDALDKIKKSE